MNLQQYQTLVFDCDGVVLNSNKVKTDAFFKAALPYGEAAAQQLVDYHVARGGISRYKKFAWFVEQVVVGEKGPDLEALLASYAAEVRSGLLTCDVAEGLVELREQTRHANWLIASGGDQQELREVFAARGLAELFDGGIFGSPDTKDEILAREMANSNVKPRALFLGDSRYDHQAASAAGLDFLFVSAWSELVQADVWCKNQHIAQIVKLSSLLSD